MSHLLICLMDCDKSSECIHLSISLLSGWGGTEGFIPNFPLNESFDRVMDTQKKKRKKKGEGVGS